MIGGADQARCNGSGDSTGTEYGSGGGLVEGSRQARARDYAAIKRRLIVVDLIVTLVCLVAFLLSGASLAVRDSLRSLTALQPVLVALYLGVAGLAYTAVSFPLTYYSGHVLPRRYGLSTQTTRAWLADWLKELPVAGVIGLGVAEAMYALLALTPDLWWLFAGLLFIAFSVLMTHLGPIVLVPLFYRLAPLEPSELTDRLSSLSRRTGAEVRGVFRIDLSRRSTAANAALVGLGSTRRIVLGDTLLDRFTPDEIEAVFAHELGHHVHRDIGRLVLVESALNLVGLFVVSRILAAGVSSFGFAGLADVAAFPLIALGLFGFGIVTTPLSNAFSRSLERAADRYALGASSNPTAFVSAMRRLADQNLSEYRPERWVELLLYSHPSPHRRVQMGMDYLRQIGVGG